MIKPIDIKGKSLYYLALEVDRSWWASWTSNPVTGRDVRGGFDSHALPPEIWLPPLRDLRSDGFHGVKLLAHRAGLPGDVNTITRPAFLPAPAYRQEGGAFSRLVRKGGMECLESECQNCLSFWLLF